MKIFIALIILILAVTGCVSSSTSSKLSASPNSNKNEGKYVVWQDFTGEQQNWKQQPNAFVTQVGNFPIYALNEWPDRPYRVIGRIEAGTMAGIEPMDKVELEVIQFAKAHGADAIITVQNTPIENGNQRPIFHHEWWAIGFIHPDKLGSQ